MNSVVNTPYGVGFPIRTYTDQSLLAAPRILSQRVTSFIASQCQGIHQMLLSCLILIRSQIFMNHSNLQRTGEGGSINVVGLTHLAPTIFGTIVVSRAYPET